MKGNWTMFYTYLRIIEYSKNFIATDQDTCLCVMRPSSGARDTVCYLHKPTFSCFQPYIAQKLFGQFNKNHVLDALQPCYLTYQIWKQPTQRFPRYAAPTVTQISLYFSSSQHSLIHLKQPFPISNSAKFALSIMLYNAYFALKFGWILSELFMTINKKNFKIFYHSPR